MSDDFVTGNGAPVNPGPLRLDYDAGDRVPSIGEVCWLLSRAGLRVRWMRQCRSPGGKGWHVTMQVSPRPRTCMEVVALQAVLGSDAKREACNTNRARMVDGKHVPRWWRSRWNVLYA